MKRFLSSALAAAAVSVASPWAHAQYLQCGNDFTQLGMGKADVLYKCGAPMVSDSFCKPVPQPPAGGVNAVCEKVEELTYNPGRGQFLTILRFESGVLKQVRYGDRVR